LTRAVRLDRLLGRAVHGLDGRRVGRLEEFRAVRRDSTWVISEYVIGVAGLLERFGMGLRLLIGRAGKHGYVARWDQIDVSDPERPQLRCAIEALERLR
jgi:hypothetical protein